MSAEHDSNAAATAEGDAPAKSGKKKLIVIGAIVLIVLAQLAVVYFFLLSPGSSGHAEEPAAAADDHGGGHGHGGHAEPAHEEASSHGGGHGGGHDSGGHGGGGHGGGHGATTIDSYLGDLAEVNIGQEFNCVNGKAHEGSVIHVTFKVVALVNYKEEQAFKLAIKSAEARIKEAVMIVARQADTEALNDPNLGSLKRLIREQVNKILRKSYIRDVVIHEYSLIER